MTQRPVLCPRCRTLIGSEETTCSRCGTSRTAPWWRFVAMTRGASGGAWVTGAIITVNLLYYGLSLVVGAKTGRGGFLAPGSSGLLLLGATGSIPVKSLGRYWTLLSANYLHGGILHLLFNLMALRQIAPWVANEYGTSRMFIIYTLSGVFGFWVSCLAGVPFTIGASAAVCGLIGALLHFGRDSGGAYGRSVYREVSGWVVSLLIFGLIVPGINNWGHGGGMIGGMLLGRLLGYGDRVRETASHTALALLCAVATAAALGWAALTTVLG